MRLLAWRRSRSRIVAAPLDHRGAITADPLILTVPLTPTNVFSTSVYWISTKPDVASLAALDDGSGEAVLSGNLPPA